MKSARDLESLLRQIDHKSYKCYKETRGMYRFGKYVLSIDHVQGDPFAAPSSVSVLLEGSVAGFPRHLYDMTCKRVALQDALLRKFGKEAERVSFKAKGSGKSGLLSVTRPGPEVLDRTGCQLDAANGNLVLRMEVGFPANGRSINAGELIKILFDFVPKCVEKTLFYDAYDSRDKDALQKVAELARDQQYIREQLAERGLVAFVANGSILPRATGVSSSPMRDSVLFASPESNLVTMQLPGYGEIQGMGIKKGVTLIVGGGYHGKSTLLKALEAGVYNHIAGDGREYVITCDSAVKLRAEDGRSIQGADISMFIRDLPNGKDTTAFYTEDASGSTSQAAGVVEAMEAGSEVFLIDEDTSATNFMIRDELMQEVVNRDMEPITPFIDRVRELYDIHHISTVLVAGSSGSYFHKADNIIQMNRYVPVDITDFAKEKAQAFPMPETEPLEAYTPSFARRVQEDREFRKADRIKLKTQGRDTIMINRDVIDVRYMEQLLDHEQLTALAYIIKYAKKNVFDGRKTIQEGVEQIVKCLKENGLTGICDGRVPGNLAMPRKQEIAAVLNRYRQLQVKNTGR